MTQTQAIRRPRKVRASVIRRTIVGSLVVMLSPFLTVLENDAGASVKTRMPVIQNSAPVAERQVPEEILPAIQRPTTLRSVTPTENAFSLNGIQSSLLSEASDYWAYENVIPEAEARG